MEKVKKFGMLALGVALVLVVFSFLPAGIKEKIPGVRSIS